MALNISTRQEPTPSWLPTRRQLLRLLFLRIIILTLLLGISVILQTNGHQLLIPPLRYITAFIAVVYIFTISSAFLINLKGFHKLSTFTYVQIFVDILLSACLVLYTGGSQSIFTISYFFPIICSAFLLLRKSSLATASLCTITYGFIIFFEYFGYRPSVLQQTFRSPLSSNTVAMHYFAVTGMGFFLVVILGIILAERLKKTEAALSTASLNFDRLALLYKQIVDDINSGIITVDPNGTITSFNRAAEEITGFKANEVLGHSMFHRFPNFEVKDAAQLRQTCTLTCRDGENIPIGFSQSRLNMPGSPEGFMLYTFQDLSQIKILEEQMRQAEKMAAIGKMAAGVAHEFRNPLAAISGAAQVLAQEHKSDPNSRDLMNIIIRESDRLEKAISEFLLFSKPAAPEPKWFSLLNLLEETLKIMRHASDWSDNCRIDIKIPDQIDWWADPGQMQQVLFNIINNSCLAMGEVGGLITITAEIHEENNKAYSSLTISDTGPGIPQNIIDKIFEPFFTTREKGNGLGLAIVDQIISSHNGTIQAGSSPGVGATFAITMPLP